MTSNPEVVGFLSNLPAYRTGVAPLLRGVEVGLAHGFFLPGPFIKVRSRWEQKQQQHGLLLGHNQRLGGLWERTEVLWIAYKYLLQLVAV